MDDKSLISARAAREEILTLSDSYRQLGLAARGGRGGRLFVIHRIFAGACGALVLAGAAQAADLPADLAQAARDYDAAQAGGDRAALERLLADDYLLVNSSGARETKAELIADFTAPGYKLEPFTVRQPVERVWRDGAVLGGLADLKGVDGGKPFAVTIAFADIWARRDGRWRVVFTQVTRPKP
jgi:hypothetical protein